MFVLPKPDSFNINSDIYIYIYNFVNLFYLFKNKTMLTLDDLATVKVGYCSDGAEMAVA